MTPIQQLNNISIVQGEVVSDPLQEIFHTPGLHEELYRAAENYRLTQNEQEKKELLTSIEAILKQEHSHLDQFIASQCDSPQTYKDLAAQGDIEDAICARPASRYYRYAIILPSDTSKFKKQPFYYKKKTRWIAMGNA